MKDTWDGELQDISLGFLWITITSGREAGRQVRVMLSQQDREDLRAI